LYCKGKKPLNVHFGPWLPEINELPEEFCIFTEGLCPDENLDVRTSNVGLRIKISKGVIEAKESRGLVVVSKQTRSSEGR
jgi:hypothetical protein